MHQRLPCWTVSVPDGCALGGTEAALRDSLQIDRRRAELHGQKEAAGVVRSGRVGGGDLDVVGGAGNGVGHLDHKGAVFVDDHVGRDEVLVGVVDADAGWKSLPSVPQAITVITLGWPACGCGAWTRKYSCVEPLLMLPRKEASKGDVVEFVTGGSSNADRKLVFRGRRSLTRFSSGAGQSRQQPRQ